MPKRLDEKPLTIIVCQTIIVSSHTIKANYRIVFYCSCMHMYNVSILNSKHVYNANLAVFKPGLTTSTHLHVEQPERGEQLGVLGGVLHRALVDVDRQVHVLLHQVDLTCKHVQQTMTNT